MKRGLLERAPTLSSFEVGPPNGVVIAPGRLGIPRVRILDRRPIPRPQVHFVDQFAPNRRHAPMPKTSHDFARRAGAFERTHFDEQFDRAGRDFDLGLAWAWDSIRRHRAESTT
jgi:hypothetical protein